MGMVIQTLVMTAASSARTMGAVVGHSLLLQLAAVPAGHKEACRWVVVGALQQQVRQGHDAGFALQTASDGPLQGVVAL